MKLLVNKQDYIDNYRDVTTTESNASVLNMATSDAQTEEVINLLGSDFFFDILANPESTQNQLLLNGGSYDYEGKNYNHFGLKAVIVYYGYSRYVLNGSRKDTPFGLVQKENQNSSNVNQEEKKDVYKKNQINAFKIWQNVELFLNRKESDFPLWQNRCRTQKTFRISKIGKPQLRFERDKNFIGGKRIG